MQPPRWGGGGAGADRQDGLLDRCSWCSGGFQKARDLRKHQQNSPQQWHILDIHSRNIAGSS